MSRASPGRYFFVEVFLFVFPGVTVVPVACAIFMVGDFFFFLVGIARYFVAQIFAIFAAFRGLSRRSFSRSPSAVFFCVV